MESFQRARASLSRPSRKAFAGRTLDNRPYELPPLKLDHLLRMTDDTGIFQHAIFNVPNFSEGYCTDDNARAFILTLLLQETTSRVMQQQLEGLSSIYLAFLWHAFDQESCRFRNFMSHQRRWLEREGSEDSHARALWAAGTALGRSHNDGHRNLCALLFQARYSGGGKIQFTAGLGFCAAGHPRVFTGILWRSKCQSAARNT